MLKYNIKNKYNSITTTFIYLTLTIKQNIKQHTEKAHTSVFESTKYTKLNINTILLTSNGVNNMPQNFKYYYNNYYCK